MKKRYLLLLLIFLCLFFSNSIFVNAEEGDSIVYKRNFWFYAQRSHPYDSIPPGALQDAISERNSILSNGYYLNPFSSSWTSIGPGYTYNGGRINFVRFVNSNTLIIGTPHGGLWKSTDFSNWVTMDPNQKLGSGHSGAIAIDNSQNPPVIYYGTGEGVYGFDYAYYGLGIYKTTNWGENWTEINSGIDTEKLLKIFRITIKPDEPGHIFAATNQGLYRTTTSGSNWFLVSGTENKHCNDIQFSVQNPLKAYLVGPKEERLGVGYRESTNGGESFSVQNRGFVTNGRTHIEVFSQNDNYIYGITEDGNTKVFRSTNGGLNFSTGGTINTHSHGGYVMYLKISPNLLDDIPTDIYVGGVELFKSTDSGLNFCRISGSPGDCGLTPNTMHDDYHNMDILSSDPSKIVVVNDGGIFYSQNSGNSFGSLNSNLSLNLIYRLNSTSTNTLLGLQDNGIGTLSTILYPYGDAGEVISSKYDPSLILYNENNNGVIRRFIYGSSNYGIINIPGYWGTAAADWVGAITEHPTIPGTFYYAKRNQAADMINFWKSTDYGETWGGIFPFGSVTGNCAPQCIAVSSNAPQKIYMSSSGYYGPEPFTFGRGLYFSSNGGESWVTKIPENNPNLLPFNYITRVVTAPAEISTNPDEVYITLSGFFQGSNQGHVFKSTNEGSTWININGNLPDSPVNDLVWWQSDCGNTTKTIAVGTDVGVFTSTNGGTNWKLTAEGLPIVPVMDLEYVQYKNSLRAATFGRGLWEVELEGDIYIKGFAYIPSNTSISKNIVICDGGVLNISNSALYMNDNKQIIVKYGGKLIGGTDAAFYSTNSWDGIVVEPGGELDLNGCYFNQTGTPIAIEGNLFVSSPNVTIRNCRFLNSYEIGTITINNRDNVIIGSCIWSYPGSLSSFNKAIDCYNSNNVLIEENEFNILTATDADVSAIFVDYGNDIVISNNSIKNLAKGITVSNSSPFVYKNDIEYTDVSLSNVTCGISMTNSYSGNVKQNTITNYETGIKLVNSSPLLFDNTIINDMSYSIAIECQSVSSPRLRPQEINGETYWDAGKNKLIASTDGGFGISMYYYSIPELDYGCNQFNTSSYSIEGNIASGLAGNYYLFARNNSWNSFTQNVFDAYFDEGNPTCSPGEGGAEREKEGVIPPQPIIVNYGNGIYDTIQVTTRNVPVNSDQALYLSANNDEITGSYQSAITKYGQVIQSYQDSLTAINSLRKLLHCKDKLNADTTAYSQLRGYYQAKIQSNINDTAFVNVAEELAAKCLVRMGHPTTAIDEYEVIISNTNDSAKILCAELNIIETYLIIQNSGDSPNYTGQLGYLKPNGKEDAYKKIMDRLHKSKNKKPVNQLPKEYQLSQNYPNPFNPVTKIKYALPYASNVTLKVYDILGREVISLVNEFKDAGSYIVEFNGKNYASGVYFYRIEAEGQNGRKYVERKKMVLVK